MSGANLLYERYMKKLLDRNEGIWRGDNAEGESVFTVLTTPLELKQWASWKELLSEKEEMSREMKKRQSVQKHTDSGAVSTRGEVLREEPARAGERSWRGAPDRREALNKELWKSREGHEWPLKWLRRWRSSLEVAEREEILQKDLSIIDHSRNRDCSLQKFMTGRSAAGSAGATRLPQSWGRRIGEQIKTFTERLKWNETSGCDQLKWNDSLMKNKTERQIASI